MRQTLLILFLASITELFAQDAVYLANRTRLDNAQIADITGDRITVTVQKADKSSTQAFYFQRDNVLLAFTKFNFLIINKLSNDTNQAKQEIQAFKLTTAWQDQDYLFKAIPFEVIPAKISYENDAIVNYLTNDGKSASISKGELVAIFYKDGRHSLIKDAGIAAPLLVEVRELFSTTSSQKAKSSPASPTPVIHEFPPKESNSAALQTLTPQIDKLTLSDTDYLYYRKKALNKVDEFASYLNVITDKTQSAYARNQAIDQAASLFMPAATIEVTSNSRTGARRYPVRTYLNNLKLLPYTSTHIEWTEIHYLKELSQAVDGNYYGVITAQQTFVGYGSNTQYGDITPKNVRVKLQRYHMTKDGQDDVKWNLLLGSIGVSAQ